MKREIIDIVAKLDNGGHSSNQLQGVEESLISVFKEELRKHSLSAFFDGLVIGMFVMLLISAFAYG